MHKHYIDWKLYCDDIILFPGPLLNCLYLFLELFPFSLWSFKLKQPKQTRSIWWICCFLYKKHRPGGFTKLQEGFPTPGSIYSIPHFKQPWDKRDNYPHVVTERRMLLDDRTSHSSQFSLIISSVSPKRYRTNFLSFQWTDRRSSSSAAQCN